MPSSQSHCATSPPVRIAFAGPMGSGKSYATRWLQKRYPQLWLQRVGFGDEVTRIVQELWHPPQPDRALTVEFATAMRGIDPAVWMKQLLARVDTNPAAHWVCDDLRQANEMAVLRDAGWVIVRLSVPEDVRAHRLQGMRAEDEAHAAYANQRAEQDVTNAEASAFDATVDTSCATWTAELEALMLVRWGVLPGVTDDAVVAVDRNTSCQETGYDATVPWSCVEMGLFAAMLAVGTMCWAKMFATYVHHTMHANQSMVEMLWEWERYDLVW